LKGKESTVTHTDWIDRQEYPFESHTLLEGHNACMTGVSG
jgi:hypothetical protein